MYAVARSICGNDAAADVVQDVFLRVWRDDRFDPSRSSMRTYLLTITRGVAIDALRRDAAIRRRDERHGRSDECVMDEADRSLLALEAKDRITEALERLTSKERSTVTAVYFEHLSHREVARLHGVPEGTVKSRIRLGMIKLRYDLRTAADRSENASI